MKCSGVDLGPSCKCLAIVRAGTASALYQSLHSAVDSHCALTTWSYCQRLVSLESLLTSFTSSRRSSEWPQCRNDRHKTKSVATCNITETNFHNDINTAVQTYYSTLMFVHKTLLLLNKAIYRKNTIYRLNFSNSLHNRCRIYKTSLPIV